MDKKTSNFLTAAEVKEDRSRKDCMYVCCCLLGMIIEDLDVEGDTPLKAIRAQLKDYADHYEE